MSNKCNSQSIPHHCADKFEEISTALGKLGSVPDDVKELRKAVIGNGKPERALVFRVKRLEDSSENIRSTKRRWGERIWKVVAAAALVFFGAWLKSD